MSIGIDSSRADELRARLDDITRRITRYEFVWESRNPDLVETDFDSVEDEEEVQS
jgi:hypothetical protein